MFVRADVTAVPLRDERVDVLLDRGCFHYLPSIARTLYVAEARRVLKPWGKLLLRASRRTEGMPNGINETVVLATFEGWQIDSIVTKDIPSDTRTLDCVVARLVRSDGFTQSP